jgi:hypothetical protein
VVNLELLTLILEQMKIESTEHKESTNSPLLIADVRQRIIDYTNWLMKQNLMICEGVDGYSFRSSMIGGEKYSAEELYDKFVSEYVA